MRFFREHGLFWANALLFVVFFVGMVLTGNATYNSDQEEHGQAGVGLVQYLGTGDFLEATFENWESEFLQMGSYIVLTVFLFQRGSSESKTPGEHAPQDDDPRNVKVKADTPWPVKRGGLVLVLYENSLLILFTLLFLASVALHAVGGSEAYSADQVEHGEAAVTPLQYLGTSQFWFESFQNWQSEFMVVALIVLASVYLRQRGSSQSKPVAMAHQKTDG
ncbi:DUF6766 family protein [Naasia aerilata]|uniref:Transmembrane protein n=1 Tax=Naasia aerilata TaxID=1162966 RepID=A0ABN6XNG5_9MICO|nr:hypothetical protein GCM10025866_16470 [Naasia aerilata]